MVDDNAFGGDDPALEHQQGRHAADCGCGLPPEVVAAMTILEDGTVIFGRRVRREVIVGALRKVADALELATAIDQIELDMTDERDGPC